MNLTSLFSPDNGKRRLSLPEYLDLCRVHFRRYWKHYTIPLVAVFLLQLVIRIDVNYTESLPDHVFITVKGWKTGLKRGDYVAYEFPTENPVSPFRKGAHMVKIIGGVGGDIVSMTPTRGFSVTSPGERDMAKMIPGSNGTIGVAKTLSMRGKPLEAGPVGVIPQGSYYVFAPHPDSLDSRYAMVGWISEKEILGRTFSLF